MKCTSCGFENESSDRFCQQCGAALTREKTPSKTSNKALWIAIAVLACALVATVIAIVCISASGGTAPNDEATSTTAPSVQQSTQAPATQTTASPEELAPVSKDVFINGGTAVSYRGLAYYWAAKNGGAAGQYALLCEDENGKTTELCTASACGEIFAAEDRLYVNCDDEMRILRSDGSLLASAPNSKVLGFDETADVAVLWDATHSEMFVSRMLVDHTPLNFLGDHVNEAYFLGTSDGKIFFFMYDDTPGTVQLCAYDIKAKIPSILSESPVVTNYAGKTVGFPRIYHLQETEKAYYYSYGYSDGSANYFQKGGVVRVDKATLEDRLITQVEGDGIDYWSGDDFYVYEKNGNEFLRYALDAQVKTLLVADGSEVVSDDTLACLREPFNVSGEVNVFEYWMYPDTSGEAICILPRVEFECGEGEYRYMEHIAYTGAYTVYAIDFHGENPNPTSWRDYTRSLKIEWYCYNHETGETTFLGSVDTVS